MSEAPHHLYRSQVDFSSDQNQQGHPETEFLQRPDRETELSFFNRKMIFDDRGEFEMWAFQTKTSGRIFPSPLVRLTEGEVFQATIKPAKKVHTIHWHGIEPDPRNDGVGHTSFEVSGHYTYQWKPEVGVPGSVNDGTAGTYFYHCHVNTPLHVQMGMFGPLVVDPVVHSKYPVTATTRRSFVDGPEYDIETEVLLTTYEVDPRWHQLNHAAGLSGEDAGLDRFEPQHFYLLGGELAQGPHKEGPWQLTAIRANGPASKRKPTLLRLLNGSYFPVNMAFTDAKGKPVRMAQLISHDGRAYRDTSDPGGSSPPIDDTFILPTPGDRHPDDKHALMTDFMSFGAAERFDVLLRPPATGRYWLTVKLLDWITFSVIKTRVIPVTVT